MRSKSGEITLVHVPFDKRHRIVNCPHVSTRVQPMAKLVKSIDVVPWTPYYDEIK